MPRRLTINDVKDKVEKYGFFLVDGQTYKNNTTKLKFFDSQENKYVNLSLKQIQYRIKKDKRGEFDYMNILPVDNSQQSQQSEHLTGTQRWINKMNNNPYFNSLTQDENCMEIRRSRAAQDIIPYRASFYNKKKDESSPFFFFLAFANGFQGVLIAPQRSSASCSGTPPSAGTPV